MINFYFFYSRCLHRLLFRARHWPLSRKLHHLSEKPLRSLPTDLKTSGPWFPFSHKYFFDSVVATARVLFLIGMPFLKAGVASFFLLCYQGFLPIPHLLLLLGSCVLAIYDLRSMEYPLLLWLILHTLFLLCTGPTLLMGVFLFLGILSCLYSIGIGAGDFLLLATFSLTLSATQVLLVMQGASLIGLLVFLFKKEKDRIPFVPCLFLSYHALLFLHF